MFILISTQLPNTGQKLVCVHNAQCMCKENMTNDFISETGKKTLLEITI
jgi:hypothetical protein